MNCPKCGYTRKLKETVPEGQCPSCGVYYAKVNAPANPTSHNRGFVARPETGGSWTFAKVLVAAAAVAGIVAVAPRWLNDAHPVQAALVSLVDTDIMGARRKALLDQRLLDTDFSRSRIVMYSLTTCPYCTKMHQIFEANKVPFTEYFMDTEPEREKEMLAKVQAAGLFGSQKGMWIGTPTLEVNGKMLLNNPSIEAIVEQAQSRS